MRDFRGGRIDRPPRKVRGTHLATLLRISQLFISQLVRAGGFGRTRYRRTLVKARQALQETRAFHEVGPRDLALNCLRRRGSVACLVEFPPTAESSSAPISRQVFFSALTG